MSDVGESLIVQHSPDQVRACLDALREDSGGGPTRRPTRWATGAAHVDPAATSWARRGRGEYQRHRPGEFSERGPCRAELRRILDETVAETARARRAVAGTAVRDDRPRGDVQLRNPAP
jgi:hypothetical protein